MSKTHTAREAGLQRIVPATGMDTHPTWAMGDLLGQPQLDRPHSTPASLDRLIARIASGTATPADLAGLPQSVSRYLDAVTNLCDAGLLDLKGEAAPGGDATY